MERKIKKEYHGHIFSSAKLGGKNITIDANDSSNHGFYLNAGLDFIFEDIHVCSANCEHNKKEKLAEPTDALDKAEKEVNNYKKNKRNDSDK